MEVANGKSLTVFCVMDMQTFFGGLLCGIFFPEVAAVNNKVSVSIKVAAPLMLSLIIQRKSPLVKLAKVS